MKFVALSAAILALAPSVLATDCIPNVLYCGETLLKIGDYYPLMAQCIHDTPNGPDVVRDDYHIRRSLYKCVGGVGGVVDWKGFCATGCKDNGIGNNDSCN